MSCNFVLRAWTTAIALSESFMHAASISDVCFKRNSAVFRISLTSLFETAFISVAKLIFFAGGPGGGGGGPPSARAVTGVPGRTETLVSFCFGFVFVFA